MPHTRGAIVANCNGCTRDAFVLHAALILQHGLRNMSLYPTPEQLEERNRILIEMDVEAANKMMPAWLSEAGIIAGMHKARLHIPAIDDKLRAESLQWLRDNGFKDYKGAPLPDHLPE